MRNLRLLVFICLFFATHTISSQNSNRLFMLQMDAENFMFEKQFDKAAEIFLKALKISPDNANIKFRIGYCYLNTDDKKNEALKYLVEASENALLQEFIKLQEYATSEELERFNYLKSDQVQMLWRKDKIKAFNHKKWGIRIKMWNPCFEV